MLIKFDELRFTRITILVSNSQNASNPELIIILSDGIYRKNDFAGYKSEYNFIGLVRAFYILLTRNLQKVSVFF